jgi:hypothetical protein
MKAKKEVKEKREILYVRIPKDQWDYIYDQSHKERKSRSQFVEELIKKARGK